MKKPYILLLAALGCAALAVSCSEGPETPDLPPDNTLTGSIYMIGHNFVSEVTYDGHPLLFDRWLCGVHAGEATDTTIWLKFELSSADQHILIRFDSIPLSGKPFDVAFDYICSNAFVYMNGAQHPDVGAAIAGWITRRKELHNATRLSPALIDYAFEMQIECDLDGKLLQLKIKDPITQ